MAPDPAFPIPESPTPNIFRSEGESWAVTFAGKTCRIRDTLGMRYLALLLRQPSQEIHVLTLAAEEPLFTKGAHIENVSNEGMQRGFTDAGEILDPQARMAYRQRLRDLLKN